MRGAMQGGYVEPGPGGDPIRNPGVLPTGKNIHALDPQSIPTQAAVKSARVVVERYEPGYPQPMSLSRQNACAERRTLLFVTLVSMTHNASSAPQHRKPLAEWHLHFLPG